MSSKKQPKLFFQDGASARVFRTKLGVNQSAFWGKISVTQSGGSRYESGRDIPLPVAMVLHLAYAPEKQASALLDWLRRSDEA